MRLCYKSCMIMYGMTHFNSSINSDSDGINIAGEHIPQGSTLSALFAIFGLRSTILGVTQHTMSML